MTDPTVFAELAIAGPFNLYGRDALYTPPGGGAGVPCRVVKDTHDRRLQIGLGAPTLEGKVFEVRKSEVAEVVKNGTFQFVVDGAPVGDLLKIQGDPKLDDAERLVWICTVR